jgi:hypothetical protein
MTGCKWFGGLVLSGFAQSNAPLVRDKWEASTSEVFNVFEYALVLHL